MRVFFDKAEFMRGVEAVCQKLYMRMDTKEFGQHAVFPMMAAGAMLAIVMTCTDELDDTELVADQRALIERVKKAMVADLATIFDIDVEVRNAGVVDETLQ